jgi:predicted RNA polymerase sigma factor
VLAPVLASGALSDYGPLHAAHGFLLEKAGDSERARGAWARAAAAAGNEAVRDELLRRHVDPL